MVLTIIKHKRVILSCARVDKIEVESQLLGCLYDECADRIQRIHKKLIEEDGIRLGYSTLVRIIRKLEPDRSKKGRCCHVLDELGALMQHNTTPYTLKLGTRELCVVASLLYFLYSKLCYLKFYRSFRRFKMKCYFHEAPSYFGYCLPVCIIDNTNLNRLRGAGEKRHILKALIQSAFYGYS